MIVVGYNPDLSRFTFESLPWQTIDVSYFADGGMELEEVLEACTDKTISYQSDGITSYQVLGSPEQAEKVCKKLEEKTAVKRQVVVGKADQLFETVEFFVTA